MTHECVDKETTPRKIGASDSEFWVCLFILTKLTRTKYFIRNFENSLIGLVFYLFIYLFLHDLFSSNLY